MPCHFVSLMPCDSRFSCEQAPIKSALPIHQPLRGMAFTHAKDKKDPFAANG